MTLFRILFVRIAATVLACYRSHETTNRFLSHTRKQFHVLLQIREHLSLGSRAFHQQISHQHVSLPLRRPQDSHGNRPPTTKKPSHHLLNHLFFNDLLHFFRALLFHLLRRTNLSRRRRTSTSRTRLQPRSLLFLQQRQLSAFLL